MLPISILMALTFWSTVGFPDSPAESDFTHALESFKSNDLTQSRTHFTALLKDHPNDPVLLYNLGLVEMTDKHPGKAAAYWRKALYLQPGYSPAIAGMAQVRKLIPNSPEAHEPWNQIYWRIPLWFFLGAGFIFFVTGGVLWVLYFSRRKRQQEAPILPPIFSTVPFLFFIFLAAQGWWTTQYETWGTVLESPLSVRSSPDEQSPSLLEFSEGDDVIVLRKEGPWLQVQKSSTALGWVPQDKILFHSGF